MFTCMSRKTTFMNAYYIVLYGVFFFLYFISSVKNYCMLLQEVSISDELMLYSF